MSSGEGPGVARPTLAHELIRGDLIIEEGEDWWIERYVFGVLTQEDETLVLLMEESGELRSWCGPSETRHFVLRRPSQEKRTTRGRNG